MFNIPLILKSREIKTNITEPSTQTVIDIVMLRNVIEDIKPSDKATSTHKREILSALPKYQKHGP